MLDWKTKRSTPIYNFCCVNDWEHYRLYLIHWEPVLRVEYETVVIYEGRHKYEVTQFDSFKTEIQVFDVDPENRVIENPQKKTPKFSYTKKLFDFAQTNRDKILNRVRTILVFQ